MSAFDRNPLDVFDDAALRAELRGAFDAPAPSPESVLAGLRPRLRSTRRRYIATRAAVTATTFVAAVLVVAGLHAGSSTKGLRIDTRPAGGPTLPVRPAPGRVSTGSTTSTTTAPPTPGAGRPRLPGHASTPTTPLAPGAATASPSTAPIFALPPSVTVPNNGPPRPGGGSPGAPTTSTTSAPSTTTSSEPSTTTVPASGTQTFTVADSRGFFGTVQVEWQGPSLTFDGANPCAVCTFVKAQGDPNELDVTFTRTTDSAQAHLHLEMRSQPAWHPVVD
jgi:hypothetical protein